jgi:hypothetical protein
VNPDDFDVYRLVPQFFLLLQRSVGRGGNFLNIFTHSVAGLDMLLTFLLWERDVCLHLSFFQELEAFSQWQHDVISRHAELFDLLEATQARALALAPKTLLLTISNTQFRRLFYPFVFDPELDVDLALALLLGVGMEGVSDFDERMKIVSSLVTPTVRKKEVDMIQDYTAKMAVYSTTYRHSIPAKTSLPFANLIPTLKPPTIVKRIAAISPARDTPPRQCLVSMESPPGVHDAAEPILCFLGWLDSCVGCSQPAHLFNPAIFEPAASLPIHADHDDNPVFFAQSFFTYG